MTNISEKYKTRHRNTRVSLCGCGRQGGRRLEGGGMEGGGREWEVRDYDTVASADTPARTNTKYKYKTQIQHKYSSSGLPSRINCVLGMSQKKE